MTEAARTLPRAIPLAENRTTSATLWICAFATLTAAGAHLAIPTYPVPMTLPSTFVLLAGALLGARLGAMSQILDLAAGAAFLPVFASGAGWPYLIASPTSGYLFGFPIAAFVTGALLAHGRPSFVRCTIAMSLGMMTIFALGTLGLVRYGLSWEVAFETGFLNLQIWDAVKIVTTALLASSVLSVAQRDASA